MKRISFLFILSLFTLSSSACEICGCGVGSNYIGLLPEFRKHIFGLRYRYNSMLTHLGVDGNRTYLTTNEHYQVIEAWGGWNIGKKFRVMATVPYSFNERINQGVKSSKSGLGDINLWGYYRLLNSRSTVMKSNLLVQSLWVGAGIKLPTGKYSPADKSSSSTDLNLFQLGTGSVDYNLSAMYDIRLQDLGLNLTGNYKITNNNKYHYRYGNKYNINAQVYYKFSVKKKLVIVPNLGVFYENSALDHDNGFKVSASGGRLLSGAAGMEISYKKIAIGGNFQTPFSQNLASGIVKANNRAMMHISFTL
mgnify:CR=1 FL=1